MFQAFLTLALRRFNGFPMVNLRTAFFAVFGVSVLLKSVELKTLSTVDVSLLPSEVSLWDR